MNDDNEIQKIIEEKTGVRVNETWLTGQTADEAIGTMIAGGEYPDFIEGASGQMQLYDAGALVPLDDYIEKYPNIKKLFTDLEWEKLRQDDGHIYWIPQFSCIKGDEKVCAHNDEAFWIQARVLKWAGYPKIDTLDKYFDLIEKYNEANPKWLMEQKIFHIQSFVMTGDISALRMHHSSLTDIQTMDHVW